MGKGISPCLNLSHADQKECIATVKRAIIQTMHIRQDIKIADIYGVNAKQ